MQLQYVLRVNLLKFFAKLIDVLRVNPKSLFYGGVSLMNGIAQWKDLRPLMLGFFTYKCTGVLW